MTSAYFGMFIYILLHYFLLCLNCVPSPPNVEVLSAVPQNMTLFGKSVIADEVKLEYGGSLIQYD